MRRITLFDGTKVDGPAALREWLGRSYCERVRAGGGREAADLCARPRAWSIRTCRWFARSRVTRRAQNNRFSALVLGVVKSDAFQKEHESGEAVRRRSRLLRQPPVSTDPAKGQGNQEHRDVHHQTTHSPPDVPARAPAPHWRCRCSTRWCRPDAAGADARRRRRAGSSGSSSRTAWLRDTGCPSRGPLGELPYILESLENVKDQTVVLSGLWSKSAEPPEGTTGSDHWVAAAFLTANQAAQDGGLGRDGRTARRSTS